MSGSPKPAAASLAAQRGPAPSARDNGRRPPIQRSLVAEGIVEAGAGDPHALGEIPHRRLFETLRPEAVHRRLQHGRLIELSRSCHRPPPASGSPVPLSFLIWADLILKHPGRNGKAIA